MAAKRSWLKACMLGGMRGIQVDIRRNQGPGTGRGPQDLRVMEHGRRSWETRFQRDAGVD